MRRTLALIENACLAVVSLVITGIMLLFWLALCIYHSIGRVLFRSIYGK